MDDVMSPSLRGSGLKFQHMDFYFYDFHVSLFTREWIEISNPSLGDKPIRVSLFTREWIEIGIRRAMCLQMDVSLFTREWIEIISVII